MQTTLVNPFVFTLLARVEEQRRLAEEISNPRKPIYLKSTAKLLSPRLAKTFVVEESSGSDSDEAGVSKVPIDELQNKKKLETLVSQQ